MRVKRSAGAGRGQPLGLLTDFIDQWLAILPHFPTTHLSFLPHDPGLHHHHATRGRDPSSRLAQCCSGPSAAQGTLCRDTAAVAVLGSHLTPHSLNKKHWKDEALCVVMNHTYHCQ
ncbi:hypothetical protein E2C01_039428 [Portunus trituberculatus]|uniref:Uncharacterized protein n=1 Tax=Portunus trituberculatus TaxID=210409 RepID=A0A5B7FGU0_PORTR|nr:hypothetical protein [Portunus trituberculatus]